MTPPPEDFTPPFGGGLDSLHGRVTRLEGRMSSLEALVQGQQRMMDFLTGQVQGLADRMDEMLKTLASTERHISDQFRAMDERERKDIADRLAYRKQREDQEEQDRRASARDKKANRIAVWAIIISAVVSLVAAVAERA